MNSPCRAVLVTLALTAVGVVSPAALASANPSAATVAVLADCAGKPAVRPSEIVFACADANFGVRKLTWTGWGAPFAAAVGTAYLNDCTPNCAAGHMHSYPMVVIAKGAQRCPDGRRAYETVTYAFIGRSPMPGGDGSPPAYTYPCKPRA